MDYIDDLLRNHPYSEDSMSDIYMHIGGGNNKPSGGFLPIYICDKKVQQKEDENTKERLYKAPSTSVSIKTIMEKRRDVTPFI